MKYSILISVADLAHHLRNPELVVFDCRHDLMNSNFGTEAYAKSHIPGARFAHVDRDLASKPTGTNGRHPLPDMKTFVNWLGAMGVANDKQVVAYDSGGGMYAARLWWMLKHWLGHERVAVLDGGWDAWQKTGHPVEALVPQPTPAIFVPKPSDAAVDVQYVMQHLGKNNMRIIDARANDRYHGKNETIDPVGGHIPGAVNRFFKDNLDAMGFFKAPSDLRAAFEPLVTGVPLNQVVQQCGSGVSACHNVLAMEIAGMPGSKLYPGSWSEWCADRSRPIAT